MEIENLKFRSVSNAFIRFCKFGKVRQTEETLADFLKNLSVRKKKKKKNLPLHFRMIC